MAAARQLRSPLQAATLETVVGLLAVGGLKVGEVIRLDNKEIDFEVASLHLRNSKGGRSRVVPLDPSALESLGSDVAVRDRWFPQLRSDSFFVSTVGRRPSSGNLAFAFATVVTLAGLPTRRSGVGPNLGGFRQRFAVQTRLEWHRSGVDMASRRPLLRVSSVI
jgi:integrase